MMNTRQDLIQQVSNNLNTEERGRWISLIEQLQAMKKVVVAFSGGIDSAFLTVAAWLALGDHMLALTIQSPVHIAEDDDAALAVVKKFNIPHQMVEHDDLEAVEFVENPVNRCYFCKRIRFSKLKQYAEEHGYPFMLEGSNADDLKADRPGSKASKELQVRSPLQEAGYYKAEIRKVSKILGIPVWDRPPSPCLATRIPFGTKINHADLQTVAKAEELLKQRGFSSIRVRYQNPIARIEVAPEQIPSLVQQREAIITDFQQLGIQRVLVDLEGYRSGKLTEDVKR